MQFIAPAFHPVWAGEGDVLPVICPVNLISRSVHQLDEILPARAFLHGLVNGKHQPELPALSLLSHPVFPGGQLLTTLAVRGQDIQAVGHADLIADRPELPQGIGILPQLLPRFIADRVE